MASLPRVDADAIAAVLLANDELGLAGSAVMRTFVQMTAAQQLVARIKVAITTRDRLYTAGSIRELNRVQDAQLDDAEAEIDTCRGQLRGLIADRIGVSFDDLETVL
jgi:hypothetical protein